MAGALRLVWGAARGQFILNVVLLAVGSAALALQVLVGKELLTKLLSDNTTKDFSSAVPYVVLLAVVLAVASITLILRNEVQRLLAELVARSSMQQVVDAACRADLARFEDPSFHDRLQRAIVNASIRPLQMTNGLLAVGTALTGVVAVGAVLLVIDPLFFVLGLIAGIPIILASLRVGRPCTASPYNRRLQTGNARTSRGCWSRRTRPKKSGPTRWRGSCGPALPRCTSGASRRCATSSAGGPSRAWSAAG